MSAEPMTFDDIEKLPTATLRSELRKRNIECSDASRKVLIKRLREAIEDAIAVKCHSGTKCETGCLYWDIEWDAVECISAMGPGQSIKSTVIKVGDYDWYAELFPKGEIQKNSIQCQPIDAHALSAHALNHSAALNPNNLNHNNTSSVNQQQQQHLFMAPNHPQSSTSSANSNVNVNSVNAPALSTPDTVSGVVQNNGVSHHQCSIPDLTASSNSVSNAPALFLSICSTKKPVQMRFTVQLYHPTTARWSDPVISSLRVFRRNNHGWGWKEWMDYDDLKSSYASDGCDGGKLKLKITIDVYGPVNTHPINDKVTFNLRSQLSAKMDKLFKSGSHSDVTVVVSGYTMYPNHCQHFLVQHQTNSGSLDDDEEDDDDDITEGDNELTIIEATKSSSSSNSTPNTNSSKKRRLTFNDTEMVFDDNRNRNGGGGGGRPSFSIESNRINVNGHKRRKLDTRSPRRHRLCIDDQSSTYECIDHEVHLSLNPLTMPCSIPSNSMSSSSSSSSSRKGLFHRHGKLSKTTKGSTCEKFVDIGIDEECRDKNGRTFVTMEIPVHRCILANFSPYFESMFSHRFRENVDGKIYIGKSTENAPPSGGRKDAASSSSSKMTTTTAINGVDGVTVDGDNGGGRCGDGMRRGGNGNHDDDDDDDDGDDEGGSGLAVDGMRSVIDNVDPFVMKVLLEYMYTEQIDPNVDRYLLLLLADRYQIARLVMICLQDLSNEMNINNVTIILSISNKFEQKYQSACKVKQLCLDFICKNISFVMETSSYKNACKSDKTLTQEILTHFAMRHKQKSSRNSIIAPQKHRRFSLSPM